MSDFYSLYNRYLNEANAYAKKFELDPKTREDGHWDAFRHAYASAAMRKDFGRHLTRFFGDVNEVYGDYAHDQRSYAKHMDRWNNAAGLRLAEGAKNKDEIAQRVYGARMAT